MSLLLLLVLQGALQSVLVDLVELVVREQVDRVQLLLQVIAVDSLIERRLMRFGLFVDFLLLGFRQELLHPMLEPVLMEVLDRGGHALVELFILPLDLVNACVKVILRPLGVLWLLATGEPRHAGLGFLQHLVAVHLIVVRFPPTVPEVG